MKNCIVSVLFYISNKNKIRPKKKKKWKEEKSVFFPQKKRRQNKAKEVVQNG